MTYTEKELDQFLHGISLSLLSKKSAQHWRYDEETAKEIEWLEALERKVRADKADRKTEPSGYNLSPVEDEPLTCDGNCWMKKQNGEWLCEHCQRKPKTESNSEIPNNCEHITEDGVTCAKYPACDDCLDNPLNKVKGSKRLLKGKDEPHTDGYMTAEQTEDYRKMLDKAEHKVYGNIEDEPQTERSE